ncbi:hypothetical protein [Kribbella caucasensis]|uniref:hypothetical protein n=1 Tax=Kribbella caucasensis TaxID=2512215 RepID=UPI00105EA4C4|nr:hypothetical protein [Kribbella sp. VKM Ac-2527]
MSIQVQTAVIAAVAGLLSGSIASLAAPWVTWRIEKVRERASGQTARLAEWRTGLAIAEASGQMDDRHFLRETWYLSLRPHLADDVRSRMEFTPRISGALRFDGVDHRPALAVMISDEIDRIAKAWDLP